MSHLHLTYFPSMFYHWALCFTHTADAEESFVSLHSDGFLLTMNIIKADISVCCWFLSFKINSDVKSTRTFGLAMVTLCDLFAEEFWPSLEVFMYFFSLRHYSIKPSHWFIGFLDILPKKQLAKRRRKNCKLVTGIEDSFSLKKSSWAK